MSIDINRKEKVGLTNDQQEVLRNMPNEQDALSLRIETYLYI